MVTVEGINGIKMSTAYRMSVQARTCLTVDDVDKLIS